MGKWYQCYPSGGRTAGSTYTLDGTGVIVPRSVAYYGVDAYEPETLKYGPLSGYGISFMFPATDGTYNKTSDTLSPVYGGAAFLENSSVVNKYLAFPLVSEDSALYQVFKDNSSFLFGECTIISGRYKVISDNPVLTANISTARTIYVNLKSASNLTCTIVVAYSGVTVDGVDRSISGFMYTSSRSAGSWHATIYPAATSAEDAGVTTGLSSGKVISLNNSIVTPEGLAWLEANTERLYDNTYTIYSKDGATQLTEGTELPPMISETLTVSGSTGTLSFVGDNGKSYDLTFTIPEVEKRTFVGLSLSPNTYGTYSIPADGTTVEFAIDNSTTFYLAYSKVIRPFTDSFDITLYQNSAARNRLNKGDYLTFVSTLKGVLRDGTSVVDPVITIQSETLPTFNYCRIDIFDRYYYVTGIESVRTGLWEISLQCDVLYTYQAAILNSQAFIDRSETGGDPLIVDPETPLKQGQTVSTEFINNDVYVDTAAGVGQFVLTGFMVQPDQLITEEEQSADIAVESLDESTAVEPDVEAGGEEHELQ